MGEPWLGDDEQLLWRLFLRSQVLIEAQLNRQLQRDSELSGADYAVLVNLSEAPEGRLRGFELAGALQWEKSRLSHHLTRMGNRGLVRREGCPTDGRGAFVVLTPQGRERIVAAAPLHVAEVRRCFIDALTPQQRRAFGDATHALVIALERDGAD